MRSTRTSIAMLVIAGLLISPLSACSSSMVSSRRAVSVHQGVTVTLPATAPSPTAVTVPGATATLSASVGIEGSSASATPLAVLSSALRISVPMSALKTGIQVAFRLPAGSTLSEFAPFLVYANQPSGPWVAAVSQYDASTHTVLAQWANPVTSSTSASTEGGAQQQSGAQLNAITWLSSIWALVGWGRAALAAAFKGALEQIFGPAVVGGNGPSCARPNPNGELAAIINNHPTAGDATCAQPAAGGVAAKLVNKRSYPVDLIYASGVTATVQGTDLFAELGGILNRAASGFHDSVLVAGGTEADVSLPLAAGQVTQMATEMDSTAYLTAILGSGLRVMAAVGGVFGWTVGAILKLLDGASCVGALVSTAAQLKTLSAQSAEQLASAGLTCLGVVARKGAGAVLGAVLSFFSLLASLATSVVAGVWTVIDSISGTATQVLTVAATVDVKITFTSTTCAGCVVSAWNSLNLSQDQGDTRTPWSATISKGQGTMSVPWSETRGMSFSISTPQGYGIQDAIPFMGLGFAGIPVGTSLTFAQVGRLNTAGLCWAGTELPIVSIGLSAKVTYDPTQPVPGGGIGAYDLAIWASPTIATIGSAGAYDGTIGINGDPVCS